jgi:hypothetical protein
MRRIMIVAACAAMAVSSIAAARAVVDGRLQVEPAAHDRYVVDGSRMGKAEMFGYVGDFVDRFKITGIVLLKGDKASDEQKHIIAITAAAQHLDAFIDEDGGIKPLVDPMPANPAAPPAVDQQAPAGSH